MKGGSPPYLKTTKAFPKPSHSLAEAFCLMGGAAAATPFDWG